MALSAAQIAKLEQKLLASKSVSVDGLRTDNSVADTIMALNYANSMDAVSQPKRRPFRINFFRSPGGVYGVGRIR